MFDKSFPHKEGLVQHINNWIQMFNHNYIRNHQNLNSYTIINGKDAFTEQCPYHKLY